MICTSFQFVASDGLTLVAKSWIPDSAISGLFFIVHGLGEHSGRYARLAQTLLIKSIGTYAIDLRGHGHSGGKRGDCPTYESFYDDIHRFILASLSHAARFHQKTNQTPLFIHGHSLGGNLVLNYILRKQFPHSFSAAIVTAPWLRLVDEPRHGMLDEQGLLTSTITPEAISNNPIEIESYRQDLQIHNRISPTLYKGAKRAGAWILRHAHELSLPLLLMHGTDDPVADCNASREFLGKASSLCKGIFVAGGRHSSFAS